MSSAKRVCCCAVIAAAFTGQAWALPMSWVTGGNPLIKHAVVFALGGVDSSFDLDRLGNVCFQQGTGLEEPRDPGHLVPEPMTAVLPIIGGLPLMRRRTAR